MVESLLHKTELDKYIYDAPTNRLLKLLFIDLKSVNKLLPNTIFYFLACTRWPISYKFSETMALFCLHLKFLRVSVFCWDFFFFFFTGQKRFASKLHTYVAATEWFTAGWFSWGLKYMLFTRMEVQVRVIILLNYTLKCNNQPSNHNSSNS